LDIQIMTMQQSLVVPQPSAFRSFWEFCRPHTIIGTTMAVGVLYILAVVATGHHDAKLLLLSYIAALGVNIYVVGINQLTDIEIDRINKPYLPLASGAFSQPMGLFIVCVALAVSIAVASTQGRFLFGTILAVFALGTAYSLPPFRFKESPFWAASSITVARALIGNIGGYLHYTDRLAGKPSLPVNVLGFVAFMFVFVIVIAIMKDVPDIEGDKRCEVPTLARRLGVDATLQLCRWILTFACVGFAAISLAPSSSLNPLFVLVTHVPIVAAIWIMGRKVNGKNAESVYRYYMTLWKLYYFEFLAFPIAVALSRSGLS
jgi:homogentisate phytyltransferase/homogentisate geranylgeranyltransferase